MNATSTENSITTTFDKRNQNKLKSLAKYHCGVFRDQNNLETNRKSTYKNMK